MTDALHEFRMRRPRELVEQRVALAAVADPRADLDEFVVGERAIEFGDKMRGRVLRSHVTGPAPGARKSEDKSGDKNKAQG